MKELSSGKLVPFGDEAYIELPQKPIDCSNMEFFDELEYDCWELVRKYADYLGIKIQPDINGDIPISFDIAKELQEVILNMFEDNGVKLVFDNDELMVEKIHNLCNVLPAMTKEELDKHDILEFDNLDDVFDYFFDEYTSKSDLVEQMSRNSKIGFLNKFSNRYIFTDGKYYCYNEGFADLDLDVLKNEDIIDDIEMQG